MVTCAKYRVRGLVRESKPIRVEIVKPGGPQRARTRCFDLKSSYSRYTASAHT
jgi:hypothetical protein